MLPNGIYMETTIEPTPEDNGISLCSLSRTSTKTVKFKNGFGTVLATYKLKGTFTYGTGAPAVCTAASCTTSTKSSAVKFTAKSAYKSGNQAIGSYTLTSAASTTKKTLTITCSPSGAIS